MMLLLSMSCRQKPHPAHHTSLTVDSAIAAMAKPVNSQVVNNIESIQPEINTRIIPVTFQGVVNYDTRKRVAVSSRVAGRIEKLYIRYNFQPVKKGQLIMQVYSPDLAAAQRELIYIARQNSNNDLLQKAKQRLLLLGLSAKLIEQIIQSGQPLYSVPVYSHADGYIVEQTAIANAINPSASVASSSGSSMDNMGENTASTTTNAVITQTPVMLREGQYVNAGESLFTIYQSGNMVAEFSFQPEMVPELKTGKRLLFYPLANPDKVYSGVIGLMEPVIKEGNRWMTARIYLSDQKLHAGQLLEANIPIVKKHVLWLPESALVQLGKQNIVFKKEENLFKPFAVETGLHINGLVEIKTDIREWQVAKTAGFLVDSESFIYPENVHSK